MIIFFNLDIISIQFIPVILRESPPKAERPKNLPKRITDSSSYGLRMTMVSYGCIVNHPYSLKSKQGKSLALHSHDQSPTTYHLLPTTYQGESAFGGSPLRFSSVIRYSSSVIAFLEQIYLHLVIRNFYSSLFCTGELPGISVHFHFLKPDLSSFC